MMFVIAFCTFLRALLSWSAGITLASLARAIISRFSALRHPTTRWEPYGVG
jgi:hypothetical protein